MERATLPKSKSKVVSDLYPLWRALKDSRLEDTVKEMIWHAAVESFEIGRKNVGDSFARWGGVSLQRLVKMGSYTGQDVLDAIISDAEEAKHIRLSLQEGSGHPYDKNQATMSSRLRDVELILSDVQQRLRRLESGREK